MKGKRTLTGEGSQSNYKLTIQTQSFLMKIFQVTIFKVYKREVTRNSINK